MVDTKRLISIVLILISLICSVSSGADASELLDISALFQTVINNAPEIAHARLEVQQAQTNIHAVQAQAGLNLTVDTNAHKKSVITDHLKGTLSISANLGTNLAASYQISANWATKEGEPEYKRLMQLAHPVFADSQSLAIKEKVNEAHYNLEYKNIVLAQVTQAVCLQVTEIILETQYILQMQEMLDLQVKLLQEEITNLTKQLSNQMITKNDYDLLVLKLRELELDAQTTQNRYMQKYNHLKIGYNIDHEQISRIALENFEPLESFMFLSSAEANVQLCQLDYDYALSQLELLTSQSKLAGQLVASIDQEHNWTCAITMSYPLYDNEQSQLAKTIAKQSVAKAELALVSALANYEQEQIQNRNALADATKRYQLLLEKFVLTKNKLEIVAKRSEYGVVCFQEHSAMVKEYQKAQLELINAHHDLLLRKLSSKLF